MSTATKQKNKKNKQKKPKKASRFTAATADRHVLYQESVQNVEAEIDFVSETFQTLRGRGPISIREDFCGTGQSSCEWVKRGDDHVAYGLDIDQPTIDWGLENNTKDMTDEQKSRLHLLNCNVLTPTPEARNMDAVLAMNFSYWILNTRAQMREYFASVRDSLTDDGIFFLDFYGGWEAQQECRDKKRLEGFTYVWDQQTYNPITGMMDCAIHFHFPDGTKLAEAFTYRWRLWSLVELRELLEEAGFAKSTVYWEGDADDGDEDEHGDGNGIFEPETDPENCPAYICYIVAEK